MKTIQTIFLLSVVCFLGCTSTHRLRPAGYTSINNRAVRQHAMVTFVDDREIQVENLRITSDSTYWISTNKIATAQIKEVRFKAAGGRARHWSLDHEADQADLYEKINQGTGGRHAVLILTEGQELQVRQLWMTTDSTYWIDPQIKQQSSPTYLAVATSQIKEVSFIRRGKGALEGIGLGFLMGFPVGMVAGTMTYDGSNFIGASQTEIATLVGAYVGVTGALIGVPIGFIIGSKYKILIQ